MLLSNTDTSTSASTSRPSETSLGVQQTGRGEAGDKEGRKEVERGLLQRSARMRWIGEIGRYKENSTTHLTALLNSVALPMIARASRLSTKVTRGT